MSEKNNPITCDYLGNTIYHGDDLTIQGSKLSCPLANVCEKNDGISKKLEIKIYGTLIVFTISPNALKQTNWVRYLPPVQSGAKAA